MRNIVGQHSPWEGVDIVVHSATKFFSGHADCTGGLVCVRHPVGPSVTWDVRKRQQSDEPCALSQELAHRVAFLQNAEGTALAPFESKHSAPHFLAKRLMSSQRFPIEWLSKVLPFSTWHQDHVLVRTTVLEQQGSAA